MGPFRTAHVARGAHQLYDLGCPLLPTARALITIACCVLEEATPRRRSNCKGKNCLITWTLTIIVHKRQCLILFCCFGHKSNDTRRRINARMRSGREIRQRGSEEDIGVVPGDDSIVG